MLTILNAAYPLAPVLPDSVGSGEALIAEIDAALVNQGHTSLVVACEGSRIRGNLISIPHVPGLLNRAAKEQAQAHQRQAILKTLARWPVDLVHLHGLDFKTYLPPAGCPALVTLHSERSRYPKGWWRVARPQTYFNCVSASQRREMPSGLNWLPEIENGVPVPEGPLPPKRNFALALGRICPEKAFHIALDASQMADMPFRLGGRVFPYPEHLRYFQQEIEPRLDGSRHFLGPITGRRKRWLLGGARCLVVSSTGSETSSLAAMEALAAGTPVVAFPVGPLPEIIDHGRTGFLVEDVAEMALAMREVCQLDPEACRIEARTRFSRERMRRRYLEAYQQLGRFGRSLRGPSEARLGIYQVSAVAPASDQP